MPDDIEMLIGSDTRIPLRRLLKNDIGMDIDGVIDEAV